MLSDFLPEPGTHVAPDDLLSAFLSGIEARGIALYPAQEEAILALYADQHVILSTPTGSGKSLVAEAMQFRALAENKRCIYTAPIKALVSEKFFDAIAQFGAEQVGMLTGDASVNPHAPLICCTAEVLAQMAQREGEQADIASVVMDEFHFYGDPERGVAWQVPLLLLRHTRFLLMSATLGNTDAICTGLEAFTSVPVQRIITGQRPVPLAYLYSETPLQEEILSLIESRKTPTYIVHFTQRATVEKAQDLMSINVLSKEQKRIIAEDLKAIRFDSPFGKELKRFLGHGIGVHHAGMLPKYRRLVERLTQQGKLPLICGTDTLGVGINVPIRSVLFTQLCKYDGRKTSVLSVRAFQQIAGRAGRKGFDEEGFVVAQAPEHVIENKALERKLVGDPKRRKKAVFKKPPERGYAHWDEAVFQRLTEGEPEALTSQFAVDHGMLLHMLDSGSCQAFKAMVRRAHEPRTRIHQHLTHAAKLFRSLVEHGVLRLDGGLHIDGTLPEDLSLNRALSLFAWTALELWNEQRQSGQIDEDTFALKVLSLMESTLENPEAVLRQQLDKKKTDAINEMKAAGIEYEARMAKLETIDIARPEAEELYMVFDAFRQGQPWIADGQVRPKSVARDMYEQGHDFVSYVKELGLARSEGVLLRYLSDAYKMLRDTLPDECATPQVLDVLDWLHAMVKGVDSSLIDEWTALQAGNAQALPGTPFDTAEHSAGKGKDEPSPFDDDRQLELMVRTQLRRALRHVARRDATSAWATLNSCIDDPTVEHPLVLAPLQDVTASDANASDANASDANAGKQRDDTTHHSSGLEPSPAGPIPHASTWNPETFGAALQAFWTQYDDLQLDGTGLSASLIRVQTEPPHAPGTWLITQVLPDPERNHDWQLQLMLDLPATRTHQALQLRLLYLGPTSDIEGLHPLP